MLSAIRIGRREAHSMILGHHRIFADSRCQRVDLIRPLIWQDDRVEWWYRQNLYFSAIHPVFEELHALARTASHHRSGLGDRP